MTSHGCQSRRIVFRVSGTLDLATGVSKMETLGKWGEEPCGSSLFGDEEKRSGLCRSCASGWTDPHNFPVGAFKRVEVEGAVAHRNRVHADGSACLEGCGGAA